jgi:exodeoxyribonuclease III
MKIVSWNLNGIRAIAKKSFFTDLELLGPDILCMQETKAQDNQIVETLEPLNGYRIYSNSAKRPGYSGTAVISKIKPMNVTKGINIKEHDTEGRVLCLELQSWCKIKEHWLENRLFSCERVLPAISKKCFYSGRYKRL